MSDTIFTCVRIIGTIPIYATIHESSMITILQERKDAGLILLSYEVRSIPLDVWHPVHTTFSRADLWLAARHDG